MKAMHVQEIKDDVRIRILQKKTTILKNTPISQHLACTYMNSYTWETKGAFDATGSLDISDSKITSISYFHDMEFYHCPAIVSITGLFPHSLRLLSCVNLISIDSPVVHIALLNCRAFQNVYSLRNCTSVHLSWCTQLTDVQDLMHVHTVHLEACKALIGKRQQSKHILFFLI